MGIFKGDTPDSRKPSGPKATPSKPTAPRAPIPQAPPPPPPPPAPRPDQRVDSIRDVNIPDRVQPTPAPPAPSRPDPIAEEPKARPSRISEVVSQDQPKAAGFDSAQNRETAKKNDSSLTPGVTREVVETAAPKSQMDPRLEAGQSVDTQTGEVFEPIPLRPYQHMSDFELEQSIISTTLNAPRSDAEEVTLNEARAVLEAEKQARANEKAVGAQLETKPKATKSKATKTEVAPIPTLGPNPRLNRAARRKQARSLHKIVEHGRKVAEQNKVKNEWQSELRDLGLGLSDQEIDDWVSERGYSAARKLGQNRKIPPSLLRQMDEGQQRADEINTQSAEEARFENEARDEIDRIVEDLGKEPVAEDTTPEDDGSGYQGIPEKAQVPKSRIMERIASSVEQIREFLSVPSYRFALSGDGWNEIKNAEGKVTHKVPVHSDAVQSALEETCRYFGHPGTSENFRMLFVAFQIYRGLSVDRNGMIFNKDGKEVIISDAQFTTALSEMRSNTKKYGHPLAYSHQHYTLAGVERYPVVATRELAEWFTAIPGAAVTTTLHPGGVDWASVAATTGTQLKNNCAMDVDSFIKYNVDSWHRDVEDRMKNMAKGDQREVLYDMIDAVQPELGDDSGLKARDAEARFSMSELYDTESAFATFANDENDIIATSKKIEENTAKASQRMEKKKKPGDNDRRKSKNEDGSTQNPDGFMRKLIRPVNLSAQGFFGVIAKIGRTMGVIINPGVMIGAVPEHTMGVGWQSAGLRMRRAFSGLKDAKPTEESMVEIDLESNVRAVYEMIALFAASGRDGLIEAADRGIDFTQERIPGDWLSSVHDFGMKMTTGDETWRKTVARIFLDAYVFELARTSEITGGPNAMTITARQVETALATDPRDFFQMVAKTQEGRAALLFAMRTSLSGVDPTTDALRKVLDNKITDAAVGFFISWYLRFGINGFMRAVPYSYTLQFLIKKGIIDNVLSNQADANGASLMTQEQIEASNELMLGGNESLLRGFGQNLVVDSARFGTQVGITVFAFSLMAMLGGVKPPDDDDKWQYWYEWKVRNKAIKENWYLLETLGFTMPIVIGIMAGAQQNDPNLAKRIIVTGLVSKIADNPWTNLGDVTDLVQNWDKKLVEAQNISEGYTGNPVSDDQFAVTQLMVWLTRRGYATFEPAVVRQIYNDHGIWLGETDLAHSPNKIYSPNPTDDPLKTEMTTWQDSQKRRVLMPSPGAGALANWVAGLNNRDTTLQSTGYLRNQMPLITNEDPTQKFWISNFSYYDANDNEISFQKWTEEQRNEKKNLIVNMLSSGKAPSELAANGIAIPMEARKLVDEYLINWQRAYKNEYEARRAAGEWWNSGPYSVEKNKELKTAQNEAYAVMVKNQDRIKAMRDNLWSDEIPYSATKYNRWETNYRVQYTWTDGEKKGQPADPWDYITNRSQVSLTRYPSGDHKSSIIPFLAVDDQGNNTYDAQTQVSWQNDSTDPEFIKKYLGDAKVPEGMYAGQKIWDLLTGNGAVQPGQPMKGDFSNDKLIVGDRAFIAANRPIVKTQRADYNSPNLWSGDLGDKGKPIDWSKIVTDTGTGTGRAYSSWGSGGGGGGWGSSSGGGGFAAKIYSHPAYSLNTDKPAGLYIKTPSYTRFDYLRPKFLTKGSREAYRREDF